MKEYVMEFREILQLDVEKAAMEIEEKLGRLRKKLEADGIDAEEALMMDVLYYEKNFRSRDNERCESIRSAMRRDDNMQEADRCNQVETLKSLEKAANITITLGGHIHEVRCSEKTNSYEGARFYQKDEDGEYVEYAVLSVDLTTKTYDWIHHVWNLTSGNITERQSTSRYKVPIHKNEEDASHDRCGTEP